MVAGALLLCGNLAARVQSLNDLKPAARSDTIVEREVREFYDSYAEDLRKHRRESIADRYDQRGVFFLGNGRKAAVTFEANKESYLTEWKGPQSFRWKDLSVEVLSRDAAVVLAQFEWQTDKGETLMYSYTGLLVKRKSGWRIRVEDESRQPAECPAP